MKNRSRHGIPVLLALLLGIGAFGGAGAQTPKPAGAERVTPAPGSAQDGSKPSEGAIVGGSILPGESAGVPDKAKSGAPGAKEIERCRDLSGTLRDECLKSAREKGQAREGPQERSGSARR